MNELFEEEKLVCTHFNEKYERFYGAIVPPIFENTLFTFPTLKELFDGQAAESENYVYTRGTNPTVEILETKLAELEHGESCKLFSSGMAAISSAMTSFLSKGDHILFVNNIYGPAIQYAAYMEKFGVEYSIVTELTAESILNNIKENTKIIYMESPGTMTFKLLDIQIAVDAAKQKNIITMIDNTWATPLFQKPLDMGVDISIHSCTKYIGGHSDVIAGAVITNKKLMESIFKNEYMLHGGCIGPFEGWLLLRGLRTLPIRMEKHQESALKVAQYLKDHPKVNKVNYPGLKSHPDYELGKKQLKGFSGLMSFELKNESYEAVEKAANSCKLFKIGASWGGYESLITSPNHGNNEDDLKKNGMNPGLIRISVGLEGADNIIADLEQALAKID